MGERRRLLLISLIVSMGTLLMVYEPSKVGKFRPVSPQPPADGGPVGVSLVADDADRVRGGDAAAAGSALEVRGALLTVGLAGEQGRGAGAGGTAVVSVGISGEHVTDGEGVEDTAPVVLPTSAPGETNRVKAAHPRAADVSIVFGILTDVDLIETRLKPLLLSSLRHEESFAFFLKNESNLAALAALRAFVEQRGLRAHVVDLEPLADMRMSIRNSWADLPVLRYLIESRPDAQWFSIVDDDTYILTANTRHILAEYTFNASAMEAPLYVGDLLSWGKGGGWRLVKNPRTGKKTLIQSSKRKPVDFVVGGAGIFINSAAAKKIAPHLQRCMAQHFHPAGDIRLGACMQEHHIPITRRKEFIRDVVFRAVGELELYNKSDRPLPASFHRFRSSSWYRSLARVEAAKPRGELVTWDDLRAFYTVRPPYYEFLFFPRRFANFTKVYGIRTPAPMERRLARSRYTIPPRGNPQADEW